MKTKHLTVRLDDETAAIVEKYQAQLGTQTSETISRLIRAADGEKFVSVISTAVAHTEELSFFAGRIEKAKLLWREIKSRMAAPRPIDPNDTEAIKQWRTDRQKFEKFYADCDELWRQSHALAAELTGISSAQFQEMQHAANFLKVCSDDYVKGIARAKNSADRKEHMQNKQSIDSVLVVLNRLGVQPSKNK
jgi:phage host-nuclease inhibitor protein Gam